MVRLNFPSELSEEEEMLQRKYAKLKKKKKSLQALRAPKTEPPPSVSKPETKRTASEAALDAKEEAKKLLKSGAIKLQIENKEKHFKRAKSKSSKEEKVVPQLGFQPFSSSHGFEEEEKSETPRPRMKNLYNSFVKGDDDSGRQGHTIYVHGHGITEELLRSAFSKIGNIVHITNEANKDCGFVSFDKTESADKAINEMNGVIFSNIQLKVSMARRQPNFDLPPSDGPTSNTWSTIAASHSQKGTHNDSRELVAYTDEDIF